MNCQRKYFLYCFVFLILINFVEIKFDMSSQFIPSVSKIILPQRFYGLKLLMVKSNVSTQDGAGASLTSIELDSNTTLSRGGMLCPMFRNRLGNQLFQFASAFGIARARHMTLLVNKQSLINNIFAINVRLINDYSPCDSFEYREERFPHKSCKFDNTLTYLNSTKSFRLGRFLQSWKYFYPFRVELRKQLQFKMTIRNYAKALIEKICNERGVKRSSVTLIGVHVRRGDMVNSRFGFNVAPANYLEKAVNYFRQKYEKIIFIVASNGMNWTKKNMPKNLTMRYLNGSAKNDMVVLASCDHMIITLGSYSWWSGWLSGGEVTYFKYPAKNGSLFLKAINYEDYYYPGWVAL